MGSFVYFAKKFVIISVIQVRTVIFFPTNFVKHYQASKAPSSCFGPGQIFVRYENRTDFTICTAEEKVLSAPTITELKIWRGQILLRYLAEPNKFCQPSA